MLRLIFYCFVLHQAAAVINRLSVDEFIKLPELTKIDKYKPCMRSPGDTYCFIGAQLYGNLSDPLYHTLVEYSANTITHFDHTRIHWGICPKQTCAHHMSRSSNITDIIEACLNETLTKDYRLTAKVYESNCEEYTEELNLDRGDYAFAVFMLGLLGLNILGSLYDFFCEHGKSTFMGRFLLCFAIRRNWQRLASPGSSSPMQRRIKVVYCFRTITAFLVVCGHSPIPSLIVGNYGLFIEESYHNVPFHLFYNGTLIVQTFFLISGLLLAYNMLLSEQRRAPSWANLPKGVLLRWLRLTPPYAVVMFFVMTWMRHLSSGPFYLKAITSEATACQQDWWLHLLYIHNYKDGSQCMAHAWYLAADFQLTIIGLLVFCILYSNRSRKLAIAAVVGIGLLTPAVHTYVQDLHAVLVVSPEVALNFFVADPTFNNLYKRGHTNLVCYGLGMAMAYLVYNLKDSNIGAAKYKKYRLLLWLLFPIMLMVVLAGCIFYIDEITIPIAVRVVYSSAVKFVFGFLNALFMLFAILKVDKAFRGFLHWGGWARISRITYMAYLVHVPILRFSVANADELVPISRFWLVSNFLSCISMAYMFAVPLFLTVESPLAEVVKVLFFPPPKHEKTKSEKGLEEIKTNKDTLEA